MPRVRVIMMQKDEGDTLARWLSHYVALFEASDLTILDNGSTDPLTCSLLSAAEQAGVRVIFDFVTAHDFHEKGGHFGNIIKSWDNDFKYDFALPLDCDEILCAFTHDGLTLDHDAIHAELTRLVGVRSALRIDMSLFNVPERPGWFAPVRHFHKGFVPSGSLKMLDNGQHDPSSRHEPGYRTTRLTYLHWHHRRYDATVARAREKLRCFVNVDDAEALRQYLLIPQAPGGHAVSTLLQSEMEFLAIYDGEVNVFVEGSNNLNLIDNGKRIVAWNGSHYLAANPDVADRYELTALHHYLRHGFIEGRDVD